MSSGTLKHSPNVHTDKKEIGGNRFGGKQNQSERGKSE